VGITAGSREVPGRNACERRHTYCIIIIIIIIITEVHIVGLILKDLIFMKHIFLSSAELLQSVPYASVIGSEQQLAVRKYNHAPPKSRLTFRSQP